MQGLQSLFCAEDGEPHDRYVVVGTSGSGKTTLSAALAAVFGCPHVELDVIHWLPGWEMMPDKEFREAVEQATVGNQWVVDGNYSKVRDVTWPRADAVIWLDFSFPVVMSRIIWRTLRRIFGPADPFEGCQETLRQQFFSRDSVILWAAKTWRRRRREYPELLDRPEYRHLDVFRVTRPNLSAIEIRRGVR